MAVIALVVAGATFLDQRDNNALTEQRYERRYADRVVWWDTFETPTTPANQGRYTFIQNRATAPVRVAYIHYKIFALPDAEPLKPAEGARVTIDMSTLPATTTQALLTLPPCTSGRVDKPAVENGTVQVSFLHFTDAIGRDWVNPRDGDIVGPDELEPFVVASQPGPASPVVELGDQKTIEDCTDA